MMSSGISLNVAIAAQRSGVAVFPPGSTKATRMISAGISSPGLFSVDAAGALYVPNQGTRNGDVLEFAARQTCAIHNQGIRIPGWGRDFSLVLGSSRGLEERNRMLTTLNLGCDKVLQRGKELA